MTRPAPYAAAAALAGLLALPSFGAAGQTEQADSVAPAVSPEEVAATPQETPPPSRADKSRHRKMGSRLWALYEASQAGGPGLTNPEELTPEALELYLRIEEVLAAYPVNRPEGGFVTIDAVAEGDAALLLADLEALGLENGETFRHMVSGRFPIRNLPALEGLDSLRFAKPFAALRNVGAITSQGDASILADDARAGHSIDGSGFMVGAISTSFDCLGGYAADVTSGDLPAGVSVLDDLNVCTVSEGTDEGRALLQHVYDVAPGTTLAFHTGSEGTPSFAQGILDLQAAGADVIIDDLGPLDEPFFQDGLLAKNVETVVAAGIPYVVAAGNWADFTWEDDWRGATDNSTFTNPQVAHDFDPGAGTDFLQSVTVPVLSIFVVILQWDQPYASATGGSGATTDLDLFLLPAVPSGADPVSTQCPFSGVPPIGGIDPNVSLDPVEVLQFVNCDLVGGVTAYNLYIEKVNPEHPDPTFLKYIVLDFSLDFSSTINEYYPGSGTKCDGGLCGGTIWGHANAANALTTGVAHYLDTPEFGTTPPVIEDYSSHGPLPILFDLSDNPLPTPEIRLKPDVVCPDGANISFDPCTSVCLFSGDIPEDVDDYPNFFGTSAASSHCAGAAALLLEKTAGLFPADVYDAMRSTALDMGTAGFDFITGYGLVQMTGATASVACTADEGFNFDLTGGPITTTEDYDACGTITTDVSIDTPGDVNAQAGKRVVLEDGFTVGAGATFVAGNSPSL